MFVLHIFSRQRNVRSAVLSRKCMIATASLMKTSSSKQGCYIAQVLHGIIACCITRSASKTFGQKYFESFLLTFKGSSNQNWLIVSWSPHSLFRRNKGCAFINWHIVGKNYRFCLSEDIYHLLMTTNVQATECFAKNNFVGARSEEFA